MPTHPPINHRKQQEYDLGKNVFPVPLEIFFLLSIKGKSNYVNLSLHLLCLHPAYTNLQFPQTIAFPKMVLLNAVGSVFSFMQCSVLF
eukprot:c47548_g1_i1 orf=327-590(+)